MTITDVELLEVSVVSVPCNQDSLFSLAKVLILMMNERTS